METVIFYLLSLIAVVCGLFMVLHKNPVYSAIFLVQTLFALAGLYLLLNAQFLAVIQILVYAGAIIVLFLFVIMLLNLRKSQDEMSSLFGVKLSGLFLAVILIVEVAYIILGVRPGTGPEGSWSAEAVEAVGNTETIGKELFTTYLFPFEVASLLLLVAMIGMVVLAKRQVKEN